MKLSELNRVQKFFLLAFVWSLLAVVLFMLAEGALRLRSYVKTGFWWGVNETYIVDDATGLRIPKPGLDTGRIVIDERGFRNPPVMDPKPVNTIRIAFLGASTTYCAEVSSNEATWPHLVTAALQERYPDVKFDYINGGVPGYGVEHSVQNLRDRIAPLSPDIIVIYHATNDLSFNSYEAAVAAGVAAKRASQDSFWLSKYSLLSHLVELNLKILSLQNAPQDKTGKLKADAKALAKPFAAELSELVQLSQQVAPVVAIATFSVHYRRDQTPQQQATAASTSLYYMPYMTISDLLDSFDEYNEAIRAVSRRHGILLIEGESVIPGDPVHFNDSVHFTDAGSRKMAERIAQGLLDSPSIATLVTTVGSR